MNKDYEPVGKYLSIAYRALNSLLDEQLARYDIDRGQFPILIALYRKEGISQKEICDFYNIDKAAVGRAVKKLVEKEFIIRKTALEDRRQYCLYLTEEAIRLKPVFLDILKSTEKILIQGLTNREVEQLKKMLKTVVKNLGVKDLPEFQRTE